MKVAISTSHKIHLPVEQSVCELYPLGFKEIQIGTPHYQGNLSALRFLGDKLGINYTVHAPFFGTKDFIPNPSTKDEELFGKTREILIESLINAEKIRSKIVVVHVAEPIGENSLDSSIEMFRILSKEAGKRNQIICIENKMPNSRVGFSPEDMRRLIDEVDSDNVGICFDTGHAIASLKSERKALEFFESFIDVIRDVHIVPGTYEWDVATPPQMEPHFYRKIVQILDDAEYMGNLTIEAVPEIPDSELIKGARYLRATIVEHFEGKILEL